MSRRRYLAGAGILTLALLVGLNLAGPGQALAIDDGFNVEVSPLPIILSIAPGQATTTSLRVRNAGVTDEQLQVKLLKVTEDNNGKVRLTQPGPADTFVHWVHFSQTTFDAPPSTWETITMTIQPPATAAFGYYFAVEYTRANPVQPSAGQAATNGAVATFVLLDVDNAGAQRQASIVSFTTAHRFYDFLPATFAVKLHAGGNIQVAPSGNIFIQQGSKTLATLDVNQTGGNILSNSGRIFTTQWNDGFPHYVTKTGQTKQQLVWNWSQLSKLRFGHYTANLVMVYNNGQRDVPLQATLSFWVIPWELVLAVAVVGGLLIIGLVTSLRSGWRLTRRSKRK